MRRASDRPPQARFMDAVQDGRMPIPVGFIRTAGGETAPEPKELLRRIRYFKGKCPIKGHSQWAKEQQALFVSEWVGINYDTPWTDDALHVRLMGTRLDDYRKENCLDLRMAYLQKPTERSQVPTGASAFELNEDEVEMSAPDPQTALEQAIARRFERSEW